MRSYSKLRNLGAH
uniref:Uncharacterized protein n=1 Tax=Anguilla anguilla TaxID=7936 RepID=A0A0E9TLS7_ANGAN